MCTDTNNNFLATFKIFLRKFKNLPRFVIRRGHYYLKWKLMFYQKNHPMVVFPKLKNRIWKMTGVKALGNFKVGQDVYYDVGYAKYITIEEGAVITSRCLLLCHKRILDNYCVGDDYYQLPYQVKPIILKRGCVLGMGTIVMPGVTIGEGSIVGAGSVVSHDIPAWSIAVGIPAKVVREIMTRNELVEKNVAK
jgi:acetyltransferase-like isoleucine patch superfamily enzyme